MQRPLEALLAARPVVILDGALATEMERRGADLFDPLWSAKYLIEQPGLIRAVHADYFKAGADVATTATYQATFEAFRRRGMDREAAAQLMRDAVRLATEAREEFWSVPANREGRQRPLVAASIGPYGAMLADGSEYRGHYARSDGQLRDFHRLRFEVLAESGADLLAFETIPCLREALVLARLLEEFPSMSAWISFSCQDGGRNSEGEDIGACAAALQPCSQIAAVGINCTRPEFVESLLRRMREHTGKPLLTYPNSGETYDATAKVWRGNPHLRTFADQARSWYDAGARIMGGCCRTTPQDIRTIYATYGAAR
ncbi:MAG: homocysteine S-methyltransferase [Gammaproteobacteria bacterium]|jgi:homocysteine S-methyltransferase|nr:homocysteine S-methyltransferase [Gammaproteobacteria bacterium]